MSKLDDFITMCDWLVEWSAKNGCKTDYQIDGKSGKIILTFGTLADETIKKYVLFRFKALGLYEVMVSVLKGASVMSNGVSKTEKIIVTHIFDHDKRTITVTSDAPIEVLKQHFSLGGSLYHEDFQDYKVILRSKLTK